MVFAVLLLGLFAPAAEPQVSGPPRAKSVAAEAQPGGAASARPPATAPAAPATYEADALAEEYRIAPGDTLQVFVWREPELSREVRVRADGLMTVPLLGDLSAVGKTPRALASELARMLGKFITAPNVSVTVTYSSTLRFFVVGEVIKPGEYPLLARTSVLQALALGGGFKEFAKTEDVKIIRQEVSAAEGRPQTREIVLRVNYKALAQGQNLRQNFLLKPGDVIVVP
jgi:polysaccharide export outer membrane protein